MLLFVHSIDKGLRHRGVKESLPGYPAGKCLFSVLFQTECSAGTCCVSQSLSLSLHSLMNDRATGTLTIDLSHCTWNSEVCKSNSKLHCILEVVYIKALAARTVLLALVTPATTEAETQWNVLSLFSQNFICQVPLEDKPPEQQSALFSPCGCQGENTGFSACVRPEQALGMWMGCLQRCLCRAHI